MAKPHWMHPPGWAKTAIPTVSGWRHPRTNELLKAQNFSKADCDAYMGIETEVEHTHDDGVTHSHVGGEESHTHETVKEEVIVVDEGVVQLNEAPPNNKALNEMSKRELENLGREHGVELDRRHNKKTLIQHLKEVIE